MSCHIPSIPPSIEPKPFRLLHSRPIRPEDNAAVEALARRVLAEVNCVGPGLTSEDPELTNMAQTYQVEGSRYWVLVETPTGRILGSGGFARLRGTSDAEATAELQKFYFDGQIRGRGLGRMVLEMMLDEAQRLGYRTVYLETLPSMAEAITLYKRAGFVPIDDALGDTGHHHPDMIRMACSLNARE